MPWLSRQLGPTVASMAGTSAVVLLTTAFASLEFDEQLEAYRQIRDVVSLGLAERETETERYLRGLRRVTDVLGAEPNTRDYTRVRQDLIEQGEDIAPLGALVKAFGTWRLALAKEALFLSDDETALAIEGRFRKRRMGKVHRYRDDSLASAITRCAEHYGHPPLAAEYEAWRHRELELAKARGEELALPSPSPFRNRYGTWEGALVHYGFDEREIRERHEASRELTNQNLLPFQFGQI